MSQTDVDQIDFMDPAVQEDWFPHYRRLREEAPVWRVPSTGEYFLSRYDDVTYVLRHPELFPHTSTSSEFRLLESEAAMRYYEEHGWRRKQTLGIDPPVHREYRVLVDPWFNAAGAEQQRAVIERLATSLMDEWIDDGEVEIVRQFAMPLPVMVITTVLGFPLSDIEQLKRWSEAWVMPFSRGLTPDQEMYVAEQGVEFQQYIYAHLQEKRRNPGDDVLSHLAHVDVPRPRAGRRSAADRPRDRQPHRPPLHRRQRDDDVRHHLGPVAPDQPPGRGAPPPCRASADPDVRRRGAASGVADSRPVAWRRPRRRDRWRHDPEGLDRAHPLRRRQPGSGAVRRTRRSRPRTPQRRAARCVRGRRAPMPGGGPVEARATDRRRAVPAADEQPALHPGPQRLLPSPGYWLRALKELHVSFDPIKCREEHRWPMRSRCPNASSGSSPRWNRT